MLAALVAVGTVGTGNLLHDSHKLVSDYAGEPHVPGWRMIDHVHPPLSSLHNRRVRERVVSALLVTVSTWCALGVRRAWSLELGVRGLLMHFAPSVLFLTML